MQFRYVVLGDSFLGDPQYVASDEQDAANYLDEVESKARDEGKDTKRENSLTLRVTWPNGYKNYRVIKCRSAV